MQFVPIIEDYLSVHIIDRALSKLKEFNVIQKVMMWTNKIQYTPPHTIP